MKNIFYDTECEFCGQEHDCVTSPIGVYCKNCWELIKEMAEESIEKLENI